MLLLTQLQSITPMATEGIDGSTFRFILSAIKSCTPFSPDWKVVAEENGISYGKNAHAKFNTIVKKHGFKVEKGQLVMTDRADAVKVKAPEKKAPADKKGKTTAPKGKKRKLEEVEAEEAEDEADGLEKNVKREED